jgi:tRNA-Thr(GGU) m(6)t(6)A37 methyltransferase TsaA
MKIIAHIKSDFPTKFGIPRQSGRVDALKAMVVFEPQYRNPDAFRGLEDFSHIWLLWEFSEAVREEWSPMVRPPRLGGNKRMGVFATRSPFRPNPIGLSSVKLDRVEIHPKLGPVLHVSGADLMDGTPIYDVKPYIFTDSHPDARGGFTETTKDYRLTVEFPQELLEKIPEESREALQAVLADDPRPAYQKDPERIYGMPFGKQDIHFRVEEDRLIVCGITDF